MKNHPGRAAPRGPRPPPAGSAVGSRARPALPPSPARLGPSLLLLGAPPLPLCSPPLWERPRLRLPPHIPVCVLFCSLSSVSLPVSLATAVSGEGVWGPGSHPSDSSGHFEAVCFGLFLRVPNPGPRTTLVPACPPARTGVPVPLWQLPFQICPRVSPASSPFPASLGPSTPGPPGPPVHRRPHGPHTNGPLTPYPFKTALLTADQRPRGSGRLRPAQPSPTERRQVGVCV